MRRSLLSALAIFVLALLVVGFTLSRSTRKRADFRFVNSAEPKTLDPQLMTGEPEGRVAEAIFEGLTRLNARTLEPEPGVAASWEITPDGKTYTFHLREGAHWSDGHPITASDFTYAWRRLQEPMLGAEYAYILHLVRYAAAYNMYQAQAEALAGPVQVALAELARANPDVVPAAALRAFTESQHLFGILRDTERPKLRDFLLQAPRDWPHAELVALGPELAAEGERRRELYQQAARHFGVDGGVFARDPHTLVVELLAPTPYFLEITAFYPSFPAPRWAIERARQNWFLPGRIVSNGAFTLAEWRVGDRIRLARSDNYWDRKNVHFGSVDVLPIENATTALNLYLTGEVDWLPNNAYPPDVGPVLKQRADFYSGPALITYYYRINCTRKPFDDARVRRALNLAVDRREIARNVLGMGQLPATHFVPPGLPGYDSPDTGLRYDVAEAKRLLAEAGFPDGRGFPKFGILYNTAEVHKKIAEVVADQLRRNLKLNVTAYNQEWQSYLQSTRSLDYDLARAAWVGDYEDPNTFLDLFVTNGGNNQTGWTNVVYDRLIEAAGNVAQFAAHPDFVLQHVHDPEKVRVLMGAVQSATDAHARLDRMAALRLALLAEAERILVHDEFPILPMYFYTISGLVNPKLSGFYSQLRDQDGEIRPNLRGLHPLRAMYWSSTRTHAGAQ